MSKKYVKVIRIKYFGGTLVEKHCSRYISPEAEVTKTVSNQFCLFLQYIDRRECERLDHHRFHFNEMSREIRNGNGGDSNQELSGISSLEQLNTIVANIPT